MTDTLSARFNVSGRTARLFELGSDRKRMVEYALMKLRQEDWHGLADAAMDLRDIDAEVLGLQREG